MFRIFKLLGVLSVGLIASVLITACHSGSSINGVGSDTTFDVIGALKNQYNGSSSAAGDLVFNTPPTLSGSSSFNVEADGQCGAITYNAGNPPPNGSSAGIDALIADSQGCVDFARSSRGRKSSDPANLEFYAFARDAVTWAHFNTTCPGGDAGPVGCAPNNLTQVQLKGIYNCDQGTPPNARPKFTNWAQVGGDNEPIIRYLPQTGSGTLSFFETRILGQTSSQQGVLDDSSCAVKPKRVQENSGSAVADADEPAAILPYSFAQYRAQQSGAVPDLTAGSVLGSINGVAPTVTTVTNGSFLGIRYVYNVVKTGSPSYARTINFVGVRTAANGGNGYICSDDAQAQAAISKFGFVPLSLAPAGSGLPNSRCRKDPVPL